MHLIQDVIVSTRVPGGGGRLKFDFGTHAWTRKRVERGVFLDGRVYAHTRERVGG